MFPSPYIGKYGSWSFVTHRCSCTGTNAFVTATDFLPPAGELVIFVLGNSDEMKIDYQKVSLVRFREFT